MSGMSVPCGIVLKSIIRVAFVVDLAPRYSKRVQRVRVWHEVSFAIHNDVDIGANLDYVSCLEIACNIRG